MKKTLLILALLSTCAIQAQEDSGWWQRLFKKKTVEEKTEAPTYPVDEKQTDYTQPEETTGEIVPDSTLDSSAVKIDPFVAIAPGKLKLDVDPAIEQIDNDFKQNPPDVRGYRVQIYFGDLSPARAKRADFINANPSMRCYLHQAAPNFGVRVGNFRDMEEAYRTLLWLKKSYPNALIVPDEIEV